MNAGERRERIIEILIRSGEPVSGSELASRLAVSRQVIVQDVALLRAGGANILATPQGYLMAQTLAEPRYVRTFAVQHAPDRLEEELLIIVDGGGKVLDVAVEHPLYGELRGLLMLASRRDVAEFCRRLRETRAQPLSVLTYGVHLHSVEAPGEEILDHIENALAEAGILLSKS